MKQKMRWLDSNNFISGIESYQRSSDIEIITKVPRSCIQSVILDRKLNAFRHDVVFSID